jgi:FKBP12-rapamycin complex-associated protein
LVEEEVMKKVAIEQQSILNTGGGGVVGSLPRMIPRPNVASVSASLSRPNGIPPRPSTSVSSHPINISHSMARASSKFPPAHPHARSVSSSKMGAVLVPGSSTSGVASKQQQQQRAVKRRPSFTANLHVEISSLAASVSNVGQGSLSRSFSQSAAEAVAASKAAANAAALATSTDNVVAQEETDLKDLAQVDKQGQADDPASPSTATTGTNALGGHELSKKGRRMSISQTQTQAAQSQSKSDLHTNRSHRERELVHALGPEGAAAPREALNEKAVAVIRRVQAKLTGRDFEGEKEPLDVSAQVQRLINQATSHENLCQCYIGWCPFW